MGEMRYTAEDFSAAHEALKEYIEGVEKMGGRMTPRDCAMFDAGFKRGRRTPPPATALQWSSEPPTALAPPTRAHPIQDMNGPDLASVDVPAVGDEGAEVPSIELGSAVRKLTPDVEQELIREIAELEGRLRPRFPSVTDYLDEFAAGLGARLAALRERLEAAVNATHPCI